MLENTERAIKIGQSREYRKGNKKGQSRESGNIDKTKKNNYLPTLRENRNLVY
jgi:hypothetical protein